MFHFADIDEDWQQYPAMATHLLAAADLCQLQRLARLCEQRLCRSITLENAAHLLMLAERHQAHVGNVCWVGRLLTSQPPLQQQGNGVPVVQLVDGRLHVALVLLLSLQRQAKALLETASAPAGVHVTA